MKKIEKFDEFKRVYLNALNTLADNHLRDEDLNYVILLREIYPDFYACLRFELVGTENENYD